MPVERGAKTVPIIKFSERSDMNSKRYAYWTLEHSWVHGGSKPKASFWHLNAVKVQTRIVHLVALEEFYKTTYRVCQRRHSSEAKSSDIRWIHDPTGSPRTYQGNVPIKPF